MPHIYATQNFGVSIENMKKKSVKAEGNVSQHFYYLMVPEAFLGKIRNA